MIYLDNAATTIHKPKAVIEAVAGAMSTLGNAGRGANEKSLNADRAIYEAREAICHLFGAASPKEIAFTANATEALNIAIKGILNAGEHVITTVLEHNSVLRPLYEMERQGVELTILKSNKQGTLNYEELERAIKPTTKAIICTAASNLTGNMTDLDRLGAIAKKHQILLIIDASQLAGIYPIHVQEKNIDILCFTGHKALLGPQGTGGIYVHTGINVRALKSGGSGVQTYRKMHPEQMPTRLEAGTLNGHGIAGLLAGICYIREKGLDNIREREMKLMWKFYEGIRAIHGVTVYGDFDTEKRCPIVTLNIGDYDSSKVSDELLTTYNIATRAGGHCAPLMHQALETVEQGAVRFSFSHQNTEEEVKAAIAAIKVIARND